MTATDRMLTSYVVEHLDEAINNRWIRTYYQPVIRTVTGKVCGMEALARWEDPEHGLLSPNVFIPALEDAQLIHKLDTCMINQICEQLRANLDAGNPVVPVSFNLSRLDFDLCDIHGIIEEAVRKREIPRFLVNIEITESVFGTEPAFIATEIDHFHAVGYQVWMDDFGSAYSSLNVLKDFDFDELKIDMTFLSRFGERSRTIIASVVDMAKRLGIQTLAEGVETREHSEFLRYIGCEKQQGFYFGRPEPCTLEWCARLNGELGFERQSEREYYHRIGNVNTLSLSERDFIPGNKTEDYVTSMPLAFVEYDGTSFTILEHNKPFEDALSSIGVPNIDAETMLINDMTRMTARSARRRVETLESDGFARHDYSFNGHAYVMRAKFVASHNERITSLVTISSAASVADQDRRDRMNVALETLYSVYEHIDILHLDEGYSEPLYSQASFKHFYHVPNLDEAVRQFTETEVYPGDRERYLTFIDIASLGQRVDESGKGYIIGFFRVRDRGGNFTWRMFLIARLPQELGNAVMVCIRETSWEHESLFQTAYKSGVGDDDRESNAAPKTQGKAQRAMPGLDEVDLHISDGSLWRALIDNERFGVFWKDTDRRFVGCNQAFLDYFGFNSMDAIIGKNDEDMGWHVDPVPYMTDELRVIEKGISINSSPGQCIARGVVRSIVTTKRPIYRNGRIVGLVGYFLDEDQWRTDGLSLGIAPSTDPVTGLLNYSGLDAATERYIEAYRKSGIDFMMMPIDIDHFKTYSEQYGHSFGDKVLCFVADTIRTIVGPDCVLGHIYADRFVVLRQNTTESEMKALGAGIVETLGAIPSIEGTRCTIYARFAVVRYSETDDIDSMKRLGRERIAATKQ